MIGVGTPGFNINPPVVEWFEIFNLIQYDHSLKTVEERCTGCVGCFYDGFYTGKCYDENDKVMWKLQKKK